MRIVGLGLTVLYILSLLVYRNLDLSGSPQQQATPTPTPIGIYGVLLDTKALIYCQIVQQPIPTIFQTATALASITPTATTISLRTPTPSPIWQPPQATGTLPTPTQEFAATPTIEPLTTTMYVKVNALNVRNAASTSGVIQYVVTLNQAVRVTANQVTNQGYVWRELNDGNWTVERVLSSGQVWLSTN